MNLPRPFPRRWNEGSKLKIILLMAFEHFIIPAHQRVMVNVVFFMLIILMCAST